jgi:hypothetical protein
MSTDNTPATPDNGRQTTGFSVELDKGYMAQVMIPCDITPEECARVANVLRLFLTEKKE